MFLPVLLNVSTCVYLFYILLHSSYMCLHVLIFLHVLHVSYTFIKCSYIFYMSYIFQHVYMLLHFPHFSIRSYMFYMFPRFFTCFSIFCIFPTCVYMFPTFFYIVPTFCGDLVSCLAAQRATNKILGYKGPFTIAFHVLGPKEPQTNNISLQKENNFMAIAS